jgi:hypothetical protein
MPRNNHSRRTAEPTIEELEANLSIDQNALEDSVRLQPDLFYDVAKQLSLTISRRDAAKRELKRVEAETYLEMREDAAGEDRRVTETEIESRVRLNTQVQQAEDQLANLELETGLLFALQNSFTQRNDALEALVKLYLANYYGISTDRAGNLLRTGEAEVARERLNETRQRRRMPAS